MVFAGLKKAQERAGKFLVHTQTNIFLLCPLDLIAYLKDATK